MLNFFGYLLKDVFFFLISIFRSFAPSFLRIRTQGRAVGLPPRSQDATARGPSVFFVFWSIFLVQKFINNVDLKIQFEVCLASSFLVLVENFHRCGYSLKSMF